MRRSLLLLHACSSRLVGEKHVLPTLPRHVGNPGFLVAMVMLLPSTCLVESVLFCMSLLWCRERWDGFIEALRLDRPLEFDEGDVGLPGGIQAAHDYAEQSSFHTIQFGWISPHHFIFWELFRIILHFRHRFHHLIIGELFGGIFCRITPVSFLISEPFSENIAELVSWIHILQPSQNRERRWRVRAIKNPGKYSIFKFPPKFWGKYRMLKLPEHKDLGTYSILSSQSTQNRAKYSILSSQKPWKMQHF